MSRNRSLISVSVCFFALLFLATFYSAAAQSEEFIMYGIQDTSSRDSQLFKLNLGTGAVEALGPLRRNFDIEAFDIHPRTGDLYAIAGGGGDQDGKLFLVDKSTGELSLIGRTGARDGREIASASFHPDGTLWAFQQNVGLVTINLRNASRRVVWRARGEDIGKNWEGLAWDLEGNFLYGSQGSRLFRWDPDSETAEVICRNLPKPTEALDFRPDGVLVGGWHYAERAALRIFTINLERCTFRSTDFVIPFNDVETLAFEMRGVEAFPTPTPTATPTPTPTPEVPRGNDKLTAQVFIDIGCDQRFRNGRDRALPDARVTIRFANGARTSLRTNSLGLAYFSGIDVSDGVRVSVRLPSHYRGYRLTNCPNSPLKVRLPAEEFNRGVIDHIHLNFGAQVMR